MEDRGEGHLKKGRAALWFGRIGTEATDSSRAALNFCSCKNKGLYSIQEIYHIYLGNSVASLFFCLLFLCVTTFLFMRLGCVRHVFAVLLRDSW
jgi:hypothetical protein